MIVGAGCSSDEVIEVSSTPLAQTASIEGELLASARDARKTGPTPEAYRELAVKVDALRPRLDPRLTTLAERKLVFLAVPPLLKAADLPPSEQAEKLALTVWPTALRVAPEAGETSAAYLERACGGPLALECKYVVELYRPVVVSTLVWRRFKERAREAMSACRPCQNDPSFETVLETLDTVQTELAGKVALLGDAVHPKSWPQAGSFSRPWSEPAVLSINAEGAMTFDGDALSSGAWRKRIASAREGEVLGVHLLPTADVARLASLVRGARAAGYRAIALQVRMAAYPFSLREYRIATGRKRALAVSVRGQDTIQVLVQAFDAAIEAASADPETALVRF